MMQWVENIVLVLWFVGFVGALGAMFSHWMKAGLSTLIKYRTDFAITRIERLFRLGNRPDPDEPKHYGYGGKVLMYSLILVAVCSVLLIILGDR